MQSGQEYEERRGEQPKMGRSVVRARHVDVSYDWTLVLLHQRLLVVGVGARAVDDSERPDSRHSVEMGGGKEKHEATSF